MSTETHTTLNVFYLRPLAGEVEMQRDACESIRELVGDNGYEAEGEEQNTDEQNTKGGDVVHGHKHKPPFKMPLKDLGAEKIRRRVAGVKVASCQPTDASKSVADLHERIEWSCKNSCGFHGAFQQVCAHERTCDLTASVTASASQKPMPHPRLFFGTEVDGVILGDEEREGVSRSGEKVQEDTDREYGIVTGVGESSCNSVDSGVSPEINKISDALSQIRSQVIACVSRSLSLVRSFSSHSLSLSLAFLSRLLALSRTLARSLRRGCALSLSFRPFPFSLRW
jgi:hypothetical protein